MQESTTFKRLIWAVALLLSGLLSGILGFHLTEGYNFLDAVYFTVITMTTIGYEIPGGSLSPEGKVMAIFLAVFTIGIFLYTITTLTTFIVEGELTNYFRRQKLVRAISSLKEHIVVCGLGRNGKEAAAELSAQGIPFVALESNAEVIADFRQHFPEALVLHGDATDEDLLVQARVADAKGVICALPDDAANVFITLTAREFNPAGQIVARASHESTIKKLQRAGANRVILPNLIAGKRMARVMTRPSLVDFIDLITGEGNSDLHLEEVHCDTESRIAGKDLRELKLREVTGVSLLGIRNQQARFELNPPIDRVIMPGEKVFILGTAEQISKFREVFGSN